MQQPHGLTAHTVTEPKSARRSAALPFTKMHGLRNDFLVIDAVRDASLAERSDWSALAPVMCDRRTGIGADGVLIISRLRSGGRNDFGMRVINADGSEPEMCGNGLRCAARLVTERGYASGDALRFETAGVMRSVSAAREAGVWRLAVNMGTPRFGINAVGGSEACVRGADGTGCEVQVDRRTLHATLVSMGNPHAVVFIGAELSSMADSELAQLGAAFEQHPAFPQGINLQLVHVQRDDALLVRTWERGCGITQACGSGASAAAAAAIAMERAGHELTVHMMGGSLRITWHDSDGPLFMTGPAEHVFEGAWQEARP